MTSDTRVLLRQLAKMYGVQVGYRDFSGARRQAAPEVLLAVLGALGAPVVRIGDVPDALRERRQAYWQRVCEPVAVGWVGEYLGLRLRLPAERGDETAVCRLELEGGEVRTWACLPEHLPVLRTADVDGVRYEVRELVLPPRLPWGYHRLTLALAAGVWEVLVIIAPRHAYVPGPEDNQAGRMWGVFLPLYALCSGRSWGAGDFGDLEALRRWVGELGGGLVGTLPLLPAFLDEPFEPSPYAPVSRLFWNEFYLDVTRVPELERCPEAREVLASPGFQKELALLRAAPRVDYRRVMALKRRVLELLAECCGAKDSPRRAALFRWAAAHPAVRDYVRFRAAVERRRTGWTAWPGRMRDGLLQPGDGDPRAEHYHLYVQWLLHEQFEGLSGRSRRDRTQLYLDFPLGVHRDGYDTWRERDAFAVGVRGGAPPDAFFDKGQDWGFPPLHPERLREQGYRYYRACLRHHLRHAGVLRIDHVMGWHRLFWIPDGMPAWDGVYVRYRAAEFYAVAALESHRYRTLIIGEDLGTVPDYVRRAMARHRVHRMYILPFERGTGSSAAPGQMPADALAALNTHDMPPFAAFWSRKSILDRVTLRLHLYRRGLPEVPPEDAGAVLRACLADLAAGRARVVLVNLEDLWLETEAQNEPGTGPERPNWRRKARYTFEEFCQMPRVTETLREIDGLRKGVLSGRARRGDGGEER